MDHFFTTIQSTGTWVNHKAKDEMENTDGNMCKKKSSSSKHPVQLEMTSNHRRQEVWYSSISRLSSININVFNTLKHNCPMSYQEYNFFTEKSIPCSKISKGWAQNKSVASLILQIFQRDQGNQLQYGTFVGTEQGADTHKVNKC